jgi:Flp pilus assembly protein TadG
MLEPQRRSRSRLVRICTGRTGKETTCSAPRNLDGASWPHPRRVLLGSGAHGMVTAEFAVVMPAVVLVLALSLGALGLAMDQVRCVDAARAGARAASRGDSVGAVILVARRAAPSQAHVTMTTSGDLVLVSVVSRPRLAGSLTPSWLHASSTASAALDAADPAP